MAMDSQHTAKRVEQATMAEEAMADQWVVACLWVAV
jgi:hypothetical protein